MTGVSQRDVFETSDLDALEVDPQRESHEGNYEATNHVIRFDEHMICLKLSVQSCSSSVQKRLMQ